MTEGLEAYGHAIVAMALTGLMGLLMAPLVGQRKAAMGLAPGADPAPDYSTQVYRWHRAYQNLSESMGFFLAATVAAILAGASPFWVNLLASVFLLARLAMLVVHVGGIGRADMSLRSMMFGVGWLAAILLSLLAIAEVF
jgi:uncharacterized MAPEG superfamily protein